MMPKLDGFEVTKSLRQYSDVPIMMLTVRREDTVKVAGLELGADDYLTKPFNRRSWWRESRRSCGAPTGFTARASR